MGSTPRGAEGQGATFTAVLPLCLDVNHVTEPHYVAEEIPVPTVPAPKNAQSARVLCIEADATNLLLLTDYLLEAGYWVITPTSNATEAMSLAVKETPQAIILDLLLPGADGWELLQNLKTDPATLHIPVIIVTSQDEEQRARSLGADDYLRKPVSRAQVLGSVQQVLSGEKKPMPIPQLDMEKHDNPKCTGVGT